LSTTVPFARLASGSWFVRRRPYTAGLSWNSASLLPTGIKDDEKWKLVELENEEHIGNALVHLERAYTKAAGSTETRAHHKPGVRWSLIGMDGGTGGLDSASIMHLRLAERSRYDHRNRPKGVSAEARCGPFIHTRFRLRSHRDQRRRRRDSRG
jgi:hypothetical protein